MGLFDAGGGAGNSSNQSTSDSNDIINELGADNGSINAVGSTVNVLDGGVFDFAGDALAGLLDFGNNAIEGAFDANTASLLFSERASNNALDFAFNAGRPEAANAQLMTKVAGGVAVAIVLSMVVLNSKGKGKKK